MKKIMFNDKHGLTITVIKGYKTMTRRAITDKNAIYTLNEQEYMGNMCVDYSFCDRYSRYKIGEEVAVAQSYETIANSGYLDTMTTPADNAVGFEFKPEYCGAGWDNKMFVKAELMPHRIRITDIKVERLQDISHADCLREGIIDKRTPVLYPFGNHVYTFEGNNRGFWYGSIQGYITANIAFANLIDKVSGKGTWERNPWVFAYTFELLNVDGNQR